MSVELTNKESSNINPYFMTSGQIGVITNMDDSHFGRVVQKHGKELILIGDSDYWGNVENYCKLRVRLLKPGETITVTAN